MKKCLSIFILILCLFVFYDVCNRGYFVYRHYNIQNSSIYITPNYEYAQYYYYLQRVIHNNWINPTKDENLQACIQIAINKNGQIVSYELTQSSGNNLFDNKAVETLLSITPFQPIPKIVSRNEMFLNFYFKGSGIIVTNSPHKQLKNNINQAGKKVSTPKISQIKRARINCKEALPCTEEIYSNWRPELTKTSKVIIDARLEKDGHISIIKVYPQRQSKSVTAATDAVNNTTCQTQSEKDVKIYFIVENFDKNFKNNPLLRIFGPSYKIFMNL